MQYAILGLLVFSLGMETQAIQMEGYSQVSEKQSHAKKNKHKKNKSKKKKAKTAAQKDGKTATDVSTQQENPDSVTQTVNPDAGCIENPEDILSY